MGSIVIDYDKLTTIAHNSANSADKINEYYNKLSSNVNNKFSTIKGGVNGNIHNCQYYVQKKMSQLKEKRTSFLSFSNEIKSFCSKASEHDRNVEKNIRTAKTDFINKHDYVKVNWWTELKSFFIELKNEFPIFEAISQLCQTIYDIRESLKDSLLHWYKCGGGKEFISIMTAAIGVVVAIAAVIISFPISGVIAFCTAVVAIISAIDAVVNLVTSHESYQAKKNHDPAWAKIYGDRDTASDALRDRDYHNSYVNGITTFGADALDVVKTVCSVVAIYGGLKNMKNIYKGIKDYAQRSGKSFPQALKNYSRFGYKYGVGDYIRKKAINAPELNNIQKIAKKIKTIGSGVKGVINIATNTIDGKSSVKDIIKVSPVYKYETIKTGLKMNDFFDKTIPAIKKSYKTTISGFQMSY